MNFKRILIPLLLIVLLASTIAFGSNIPLGPYFDDTYFDLSDSALILKVVPHEKGGLEADVSAYDGLIKITGGTTSNLTIGIGDDNIVEIDDADAAVNDFAKFTANGLEGRSYSEAMMDLNPITTVTTTHTMTIAEAGTVLLTASSAYTVTLPTAAGNQGLTYHFIKTDYNYNLITLDGDGTETLNYENSTSAPCLTYPRLNTGGAEVTIVSDNSNWICMNEQLGQVPKCRAYLNVKQEDIPNNVVAPIELDVENYDIGNNYDMSEWISGAADGTVADHLQDDTNSQFTSAMVGKRVKNTTDSTYAHITVYNDAGDVTISSDIFVDTENYEIMNSKFVVPISGYYEIYSQIYYYWNSVVADKNYILILQKNNNNIIDTGNHSALADSVYVNRSFLIDLNKDDEIRLCAKHFAGVGTIDIGNASTVTYLVIRLTSKD